MKNKILIAVFFSVFLLFSLNVYAFQISDYQVVDANKKWTINFTNNIGYDDVTKQGIVVTDSKGNKANVSLELGSDNKSIIVNPPIGGYVVGENYTVTVGKQAHSSKGKQMKQDRVIHFSIKNEITVKQINSLTETVNQNDSYTAPSTVTAVMSDGTSKSVSVTWDKQVDTSKVGTFIYTGTVIGYSGNVILTLNVNVLPVTISLIATTNATVNQNDNYTLPSTVTATMSDGSSKSVSVVWDNSIVNTSIVGTHIYEGTVSGYRYKAGLILRVNTLPVTLLSLSKTTDTLTVGGIDKLTATVTPSNASNQVIIWTSSNPNVVAVNNGVITAVSAGIATVTATTADGNKTASCNVIITDIIITFKDKNLEQAIRQTINKPTGYIYKRDVQNITSLDCINSEGVEGIQDISGLENLSNLQHLNLRGNQISDISSLKELAGLESICLINNQISDISALKGLTKLEEISLDNNQISDISSLNNLTNLKYLYLNNNKISDISSLKGLTNLEYLDLGSNRLSDIELGMNRFSCLSALKQLTNLKYLYLNNNKICVLSAFTGLTNLEYLDLDSNNIDNISYIGSLKELTNLKGLYLKNNEISDADIYLLANALPKCDISF